MRQFIEDRKQKEIRQASKQAQHHIHTLAYEKLKSARTTFSR